MHAAPLTAGDVAVITVARLTLRTVQRRAAHRRSLAMIAELAENGAFDVLNVARSYYPQEISDDAIYLQRDGSRDWLELEPRVENRDDRRGAELLTFADVAAINACRLALRGVQHGLELTDGLRIVAEVAESLLFKVLVTARTHYDVPISDAEVLLDEAAVAPTDEPAPPADEPQPDSRHLAVVDPPEAV